MELRCSENKGIVVYSFLVICLSAMFFRIDDEYNLLLPVLALLLLSLTKRNVIKLNVIDLLLFAITMLDIVSCLYSRTVTLSIRYATFSVFCLGTYILLRDTECSASLLKAGCKEQLKKPAYVFYVVMIMAMLLAVASFFVYRSSVLSVGFGDTYHFRTLYRPVGYTCNVWAETGLVLLGVSLLYKRFMLPAGLVAAVAVMLTFSRGAYLAMLLFSICFLLAVRDGKLRLRLIGILVTASIAVALFCPKEMRTVVSGNTLSQRQSTEWRVSVTQQALLVIKDAPLMGHGNGSFSMVTDKVSCHESTGQFTPLAPNIIIQLLVEKGIVGILLTGTTVLVVAIRLFKCRNDYVSAVIGCTMAEIMVKEMTQATLTANPFVMLLCYAALAFIGDGNKAMCTPYLKNVMRIPMALCVISAWITSVCFTYIDRHDTDIIKESFELHKKGKHAIAASHIMTAFGNVPTKIEQGILLIKCYVGTKDKKYAREAEKIFLSVRNTQKEDLQADLFRAYLYIQQNKPKEASGILNRLILIHPENGIYQYCMAEAYRQMSMEKQAVECLTRAVWEVPRLLDSESMRLLKSQSPDIYNHMCVNIMLRGSMAVSPKECARYGYVLDALGKPHESVAYLRKAVSELPNLSTPWRLLDEQEKYELLSKGAFQGKKEKDKNKQQEYKMLTDYDLLEIGYRLRFGCWYGRELII